MRYPAYAGARGCRKLDRAVLITELLCFHPARESPPMPRGIISKFVVRYVVQLPDIAGFEVSSESGRSRCRPLGTLVRATSPAGASRMTAATSRWMTGRGRRTSASSAPSTSCRATGSRPPRNSWPAAPSRTCSSSRALAPALQPFTRRRVRRSRSSMSDPTQGRASIRLREQSPRSNDATTELT